MTVTTAPTESDALNSLAGSDFDAVVCTERVTDADPLATVEALATANSTVPLLFYSEEPDGVLASEATRRGATQYLARSGSESLTDRLATLFERERAPTSAAQRRANQDALHELYEIASRTDQRFEAKLDDILALGCERLGLTYGYLTRVDGQKITMEQSRGLDALEGETTPLEYTYCRETVESDDLVTIVDTTVEEWAGTKPAETFDTRCYLGGRVVVDGNLYGTLCFADTEPRQQPFSDDQETFVELIVQWLSYELERRQHESMLTELLETTRTLMQAPTPERVADIVVEAAKNILGFELNLVRLYDQERGVLEPAAMTEATADLMGERPDYEPGEGVPGEVFETGEPIFYSNRDSLEVDTGDAGETFCLPLGEYGTLTLSSYAKDRVDHTDRQVAEILAANAEAALARAYRAEELARYESVIQTVQDMVFVLDDENRCTLVTTPLAERLGTDDQSFVGEKATEFIETNDQTLAATLDSLRSDPSQDTMEIDATVVTGYARTFPASIRLSMLPGDRFEGVVGVVTDQTELAATKAELADQRDRFGYLFENLPDAVLEVEIVDGTPLVRSTNEAFVDIFGWESEHVIGRSLTDLIVPEDDKETGKSLAQQAAAGDIVQREVRRKTSDGLSYFLFRGIPFDQDGDVTSAFGIYTDITEQRSRQRQLQVLNRVFRHNLRNDLTVVLGVANHLKDSLSDPDMVDLVETLLSKANKLSGLSETVRDIERTVSHGTVSGDVDAVALLHDVLESTGQSYTDAHITVDGPDSLLVSADDHLKTAFEQIVENALKHSESDPVSVHCDIEHTDGEDLARISIRDNGPGIPETERVVADEAEIDPLNHASGLGLWLARWIVDSYGGRMAFDVDDSGTTVHLSLPVVDSP